MLSKEHIFECFESCLKAQANVANNCFTFHFLSSASEGCIHLISQETRNWVWKTFQIISLIISSHSENTKIKLQKTVLHLDNLINDAKIVLISSLVSCNEKWDYICVYVCSVLEYHNNLPLTLVSAQVVPIFMHNNDRSSYDTISSIMRSLQTSLDPGYIMTLRNFWLSYL